MDIQRAIDRNVSVGNPKGKIDERLEVSMLKEEFDEFLEATQASDTIEMIDAIIDYMFVGIGTLHKMGLNKEVIEQIWNEVCDSNFSKLPFSKDENGKVSKGENFFKPDIEEILEEYYANKK